MPSSCTGGLQGAHSRALSFPVGKIVGQEWLSSTDLCRLGEGDACEVSWLLLPLQSVQIHIDFCFNGVLKHLFWKSGLPQRISLLWVVVQDIVLQGPELVCSYCRLHSCTHGYQTQGWARLLPGPLVCGAGSHSSQEGTFVPGRMPHC